MVAKALCFILRDSVYLFSLIFALNSGRMSLEKGVCTVNLGFHHAAQSAFFHLVVSDLPFIRQIKRPFFLLLVLFFCSFNLAELSDARMLLSCAPICYTCWECGIQAYQWRKTEQIFDKISFFSLSSSLWISNRSLGNSFWLSQRNFGLAAFPYIMSHLNSYLHVGLYITTCRSFCTDC